MSSVPAVDSKDDIATFEFVKEDAAGRKYQVKITCLKSKLRDNLEIKDVDAQIQSLSQEIADAVEPYLANLMDRTISAEFDKNKSSLKFRITKGTQQIVEFSKVADKIKTVFEIRFSKSFSVSVPQGTSLPRKKKTRELEEKRNMVRAGLDSNFEGDGEEIELEGGKSRSNDMSRQPALRNLDNWFPEISSG